MLVNAEALLLPSECLRSMAEWACTSHYADQYLCGTDGRQYNMLPMIRLHRGWLCVGQLQLEGQVLHDRLQVHQLDATPSQLCLRLPMVVRHTITPESPLASWRSGPSGIGADASSEIVVVVRVTSHLNCAGQRCSDARGISLSGTCWALKLAIALLCLSDERGRPHVCRAQMCQGCICCRWEGK